jgi:diguanylate cyclase (GGDEF)-like protein
LTLGFLLLYLDHLKNINDRYGHPLGDLVLQQAAKCMQQTVRESDVVGRIGGEEFAIIAVDTTNEGPSVLADRLKENLADVRVTTEDGQIVSFTASIGCVHFKGGVVDAATLMMLADQALYTSKNEGRNRVTNRVFADQVQMVS